MSRTDRFGRLLLVGCMGAMLGLFVAACGDDDASSDDTSAGSANGATSDPGLQAAQNNVEDHIEAPTTIGPTEPIGKDIPTGKKIVYTNCGVEGCVLTGKALTDAANVLGWSVQTLDVQPTPQSIQAAFETAVRAKPDAVVSVGFPKAAFQRQLAQLKSMDIPVISATGTDKAGDGIVAQLLPPEEICKGTKLVADKMIVDADGSGEMGFALLTGYPIVELYTKCATDQIAANCPKCTTKTLELDPTSIGKDAPEKIANFLRTNPDIEHLFLSYDDVANGLSTAARNAGVDMPMVYTWSFPSQGLEALRAGERTAGVPQDYAVEGWQIADALARLFTGGDPLQPWGGFVLWSNEYDNIPESGKYAVPGTIEGFEDQYKKLWGK
jgi:ABC-type sugar transport system substrate-binding protein